MNNLDNNYEANEAYARAKTRVQKIKGFYSHLAAYVIVNIFIITVICINRRGLESLLEFNTWSTAFFWGIGVAFHAFGVFGKHMLFNKDWEDRKMKEFLDEENKQNWK
ncbi:2TM domain-containing protein [Pustulibacterium marinum]|uniref:2TM domain-containing protein n=1 Tax=Pustulibacterium marinum TaxID=1224947 RepID=A0A1I7HW85_9FLAO|nr:2TM domain-containing protein [Pustulibacterium marinum]SFU64950.1 2TM domain-containing protein [Pustulibacterium marinum]